MKEREKDFDRSFSLASTKFENVKRESFATDDDDESSKQSDQLLEYKVAQFSPKVAQKVSTSV